MQQALAWHDKLCTDCVQAHRGRIVKSTGDGIHAVFADPADAVAALLSLQQQLDAGHADIELPLRVRAAAHSGTSEARDGDFFGPVLNRCARLMSSAHGGQVLLSQALVDSLQGRLPPGAGLRALGQVRLRDLAEAETVHQLLHATLRADFPPLRALAQTPHNLALQLDSFVGRERERAELRERLAQCRLLTLLGMGGLGKSRLSVQLGAELLDDFADGVWLVELAPLSDPRLVPQAVASVLGLREDAGRGVMEVLVDHLRERQLLLILDNCEHVVAACAELAKRLLQNAAGLTLLASSRDALQVAGETVYAVPPLDVPELSAEPDLAQLARHESVRLFIDRVTAVQPQFRLGADNAPAVAELCRRLDGIPLALELAAARTRALTVQAIAARLNDRFRLLISGDKTVLPRQRTLRALIDWSHELLSEPERLLFRRLAVFAGGWTLESAESVVAGGGLAADAVLDLLPRLVEQSLVSLEASSQRYRMLETVRAYADEKLAAAGETPGVRDQHLHHLLTLAEAARPQLAGHQQAQWLARLDAERDNLLAAHQHCEQATDGDALAVRLLHALRRYWINRGELSLGLDTARALLSRPGLAARDANRCMVLFAAGQFGFLGGFNGPAQQHLEECLAIAREIGADDIVAHVLQPLGMTCLALHDHTAAARHLDEALQRAETLGEGREVASALNARAMGHRLQGNHPLAEVLCRRAVALFRELGDAENIGISLLSLAMVRMAQGPASDAAGMWREAAAIALQTGSTPLLLGALDLAIGLAAANGRWLEAATCHGAAQAQWLRVGLSRDAADQAFVAAAVAAARAALGEPEWTRQETQGRRRPAAACLAELAGTAAITEAS